MPVTGGLEWSRDSVDWGAAREVREEVFYCLRTCLPWLRHWETGKRNFVCIRLVELSLRTRFLCVVIYSWGRRGGLVTRNEDL